VNPPRPGPKCDRCGDAVEELAEAVVALVFDGRGRLVVAAFDHRACAPATAGPGERLELLAGEVLTRRRTFEKLSRLARLHESASITRVRRKAARFAPRLRSEPSL
jgi:hypothetical protein